MIYVKYLMAICEKNSIKWWILGLDIWTFWRRLIVVVCMMPLMPTISIMEVGPPILVGIGGVGGWDICLFSK